MDFPCQILSTCCSQKSHCPQREMCKEYGHRVEKEPGLKFTGLEGSYKLDFLFTKKRGGLSPSLPAFSSEDEMEGFEGGQHHFFEKRSTMRALQKRKGIHFRKDSFSSGITTCSLRMKIVRQGVNAQWSGKVRFSSSGFIMFRGF